jgi:hypothetical protein
MNVDDTALIDTCMIDSYGIKFVLLRIKETRKYVLRYKLKQLFKIQNRLNDIIDDTEEHIIKISLESLYD